MFNQPRRRGAVSISRRVGMRSSGYTVDYFCGFLVLFTGHLARSDLGQVFRGEKWPTTGGSPIYVPCPGTERTDGQTDNENEECPAEPDMKTSLRNGNGQDGVRFDLTVPCCLRLEPAAFSSESSESATNLADRPSELPRDTFSENFYENLCSIEQRHPSSTRMAPIMPTSRSIQSNISIWSNTPASWRKNETR